MAEPTKSAPPDEVAQFWGNLGLKYEQAYSPDPALIAIVRRWLALMPPSSSVLECGCGTGVPIARTVTDFGYKYHGIDLAPGMAALCQKQVPQATTEVADMLRYDPSAERTYDGVVASLSHFELSPEQHVQMVRNFYKWLKLGGLLLVSTITRESGGQEGFGKVGSGTWDPQARCCSGVEVSFMGNGIVITVYTQEGWRTLLQDAGFQIGHTETDLFVPKAEDTPEEPRYYIIAMKPAEAGAIGV